MFVRCVFVIIRQENFDENKKIISIMKEKRW